MSGFSAGLRVRIKTDPGRIGVVTGRFREQGGIVYYQTQFPDRADYVPADHLEAVSEGGDDSLDLLERGRLAGAQDLRRMLTHARLTGKIADVIYAMDMIEADFYAYQFKPLVKLVNSATTGMLIADEVGLGKTIEAGLVWTEMRSRHDLQRLLVVCPSMLREKWRRELRRRFGIEADIVDAEGLLDRIDRALDDPQLGGFALIGSIQGLRPSKGWQDEEPGRRASPRLRLAHRLLEHGAALPLFDMTVIDEAHYMRNRETVSATLGWLLCRTSQYQVLLSATPIHLHSEDLFNLVNLADPDNVSRPQEFDDLLIANEPLVRARDLLISGKVTAETLREHLERAAGHTMLAGNQQLAALLEEAHTDPDLNDPRVVSDLAYRLEQVNLLGHVVTRTRKREVKEWQVQRHAIPEEIPLSPVEQEFYDRVTETVRDYARRRTAHEGFLLVTPQRQMTSSMPAALVAWKTRWSKLSSQMYEDIGHGPQDEADGEEEPGPLVQELIAAVGQFGDEAALRRNDSKYIRLRDSLRGFFELNRGEKAVLFSYFIPTLTYLRDRLREDGIHTVMLHGSTDNKDEALAEFEAAPAGTVLLSSEIGSEGVDLQFCWLVINYDLPWNPMRVEQRIGRLDRLGQRSPKVLIWNLFYKETIDARIYDRLYTRLGLFERTLGGLEPILGELIRELTRDLLSQRLTPEEERERIDQTSRAIERNRQEEERLEEEAAHLVAYGDYILNQVHAARELHRRIDGKDLESYVIDFFRERYPGCEFKQLDDPGLFEVTLSSDAGHALEQFIRERGSPVPTRLAAAAARAVRCRLDNKVVSGSKGGGEIINQFHPLVRFVSASLSEDTSSGGLAVAIWLDRGDAPGDLADGVYVFSVQRWSMKGMQTQDYLYYAAASLGSPGESLAAEDAERLVLRATLTGRSWLTWHAEVDLEQAVAAVRDICLSRSETAYREKCGELKAQNEDRILVQRRTLERQLIRERSQKMQVRAGHLAHGRASLAAALEGQVRALEERMARRLKEIEAQREFTASKRDVCVGIVRVGSGSGGAGGGR